MKPTSQVQQFINSIKISQHIRLIFVFILFRDLCLKPFKFSTKLFKMYTLHFKPLFWKFWE